MTGAVLTIGEALAVLRSEEPLTRAVDLRIGTGGAEANVAVGLARLGQAATWIGRVGDDALGTRIIRELRAEGIDVRAVADRTAPTGLIVKEISATGGTRVLYHRAGSAGSRLGPADVPEELVRTAALVHLTGITPALSESAARAAESVARRAGRFGVPLSYDVNHRSRLWMDRDARPVHAAFVAAADVVFASEEEARMLVPGVEDAVDLARGLAALGPREAVVTRGAQGAVAVIDGAVLCQDAVPVRVVDTVGAGDGFVAGYLAERLAGRDPRTRLKTAARVGAAACTHGGDWEALPTRSELEAGMALDPVQR